MDSSTIANSFELKNDTITDRDGARGGGGVLFFMNKPKILETKCDTVI